MTGPETPHRPATGDGEPRTQRLIKALGTFAFGVLLIGGALLWNLVAFIVSSHGPCTDTGAPGTIQLLLALGGLLAAVASVVSAAAARWRRALWFVGIAAALAGAWAIDVLAVCAP